MEKPKDRRRFKRYLHKSEFEVLIGGKPFTAHTVDISIVGLCLSIEGKPLISPGSQIDLKIEGVNVDVRGRVVWTKEAGSELRVGIERMRILGLLKHFPLSDILLDLQRSEKTGLLEIRKDHIWKRIYIRNGDMIFASSNKEEDSLGETLLRAGRITFEQYDQSVELMKKTGKRQGTVLIELGVLKPMEIVWAINHQVEEIILGLFQFEDGEFEFKEEPLPSEEVITLKISAANLIYRGIKRISNATYIKKNCPPMDTILYFSSDPLDLFQDIKIEEKDREILSLINGTRTVNEILSLSQLDNFQTIKTLYALLSARIIEIKEGDTIKNGFFGEILEEPEAELDSAFVGQIEDLYNSLSSTNYYNILGITKWANPEEIKKAYYRKAKDFHPDRHLYIPSETMKNKLNDLFTYLTMAYKTLSDPKLRKEYDQTFSSKFIMNGNKNSDIARMKFQEGKEALRHRSYTKAAELFGQAAYLDSSIADYHFYSGLALGKDKKFREAEDSLNKALKLDPCNADYMAELGHIYRELGFNSRAKSTFEKAIKFDNFNDRAIEGLQKLEVILNSKKAAYQT